ncbi:hypothetical protein [Psychrobacillus psychrotolerans]|uniref:hypothetical protein n=1 Tax=Psychrobacillus psychrotolerans TaxID=126156 RepID=UPI003B0106CF
MFETVTKHDEKLINHDERIGVLESAREADGKRITKLEEQFIIFENTIHTTATETRNVMREQTEKQTEKLYGLLETAMGIQSTRSTQNHEFKMLKWNTIATIGMKVSGALLGLLSSGGLIYYYVTEFLLK